jgi:ethanolamine ammonia-lyase small subunit
LVKWTTTPTTTTGPAATTTRTTTMTTTRTETTTTTRRTKTTQQQQRPEHGQEQLRVPRATDVCVCLCRAHDSWASGLLLRASAHCAKTQDQKFCGHSRASRPGNNKNKFLSGIAIQKFSTADPPNLGQRFWIKRSIVIPF